jgi:membrane protein YdbS with pleckstrin-like domain
MTDPQASRHREHHLRTPTSELPHDAKLRRQARHMQLLTGALVLVLAMLAYSALFDLDSWSEWVVFGVICATAVGTMVAVFTRS